MSPFPSTHYKFIDYATQVYLLAAGLLILFFHNGQVPHWRLLLSAHLAAILGIHLLVRVQAAFPRRRGLDMLRHFYPILLYTGFYCETGLLNRMFVSNYLDPFFFRLDGRIFGFQPSIVFMERLPFLPLSELLYAAYFSYYVMIVGIGIALYLQDRERFFHYLTIISLVFYVCYLLFIILPVAGPPVFWMESPEFLAANGLPLLRLEFPAAIQVGPFFNTMRVIYAHFEPRGGAFPSSHVAIALCTLYFSWRYLRRIRYVHLAAVVLLCLATVYCRYHYAVDVLGGFVSAALLIPLGERLYRKSG